jgi:hypothetical protein
VIPVVLIVLPIIEASLGSVMLMLRDIEFSVGQAGRRKGRGERGGGIEGGRVGDGRLCCAFIIVPLASVRTLAGIGPVLGAGSDKAHNGQKFKGSNVGISCFIGLVLTIPDQ